MMQQLYVFILVLLIIYLIYSIRTAGLVTAEFNGQIYMVQEHTDKMKAVDLLIKLKKDLTLIAQKSLERAKSEKNNEYQLEKLIFQTKLICAYFHWNERFKTPTGVFAWAGERLIDFLNFEYHIVKINRNSIKKKREFLIN